MMGSAVVATLCFAARSFNELAMPPSFGSTRMQHCRMLTLPPDPSFSVAIMTYSDQMRLAPFATGVRSSSTV